ATAYTADYYLVFLGASAIVWLAVRGLDAHGAIARRTLSGRQRIFAGIIGGLFVLDLSAALFVSLTGGGVLHVGPLTLSMTRAFNLMEIAWAFLIVLAVTIWRPRLSVRSRDRLERSQIKAIALMVVVFCAAVVPLAIHAVRIWAHGDYVS